MPQLFLNERSYGSACDPLDADRVMTAFAKAAAAVAKLDRPGTVLVSDVPLKELQIADGYPVQRWIANPRNHDLWQRLRLMQNKAPFKTVSPEGVDGSDVEYRHEGVVVEGLGGAHLAGGMGVSLPVHVCWEPTLLLLQRERLVEEDGGDIGSETSEVEVRHVSAERHVEEHLAWIKDSRDTAATTGAELWAKRDKICPSIQFLPEVEGHLRQLAPASIAVVRRRLIELEESVAAWDPDTQALPPWQGYVRGEFETRRRLCWFTDWDGERRLFELHMDYPPKPGRLHFRLVPENRTVRIAYVGRKLGV